MPARIEWEGYRDVHRLHVWRRVSGDRVEVMMADGTWTTIDPMESIPLDSGIPIPGYVFDEIFDAFLKYKNFKTHEPTEVKVLREWLEEEKKRVNNLVSDITRKALL